MDESKETEWHESTDKGAAPLFERKVGELWLVAMRDSEDSSDSEAWGAFVDVEENQKSRWSIRESRDHSSREAAQAAADAMLAALVAPFVATARAEAALAEREACAMIAYDEAVYLAESNRSTMAAERIKSAIESRTTTATLSTDTLAAIAEARGLRVVDGAK